MSREPVPPFRESGLTKLLAVLLLIVAGALVFTVVQQRRQPPPPVVSVEPRPIAQRPDDKLGADEQATIDVFSKFSPSVVGVDNIAERRNPFTMDTSEVKQGMGTGFVWDQAGHIVTNFHVIQGADRANITLNDGTTYSAELVGAAPSKDLAVLRIDAPAQKLVPIPIGQSSTLRVGQKALAIGNPFAIGQTLTTGIVSGLGREIKSVNGHTISDVIQTDASINPGNSGGPLLDSSGRLIGMNTAIYSPSGANAGIGFAIPVDTINQYVPQLIKHGTITQPGLGITPVPDQIAAHYGIDGVVIRDVAAGGAADHAGLIGVQPATGQVGDIIVKLDQVDVHRLPDLLRALDAHKVGDQVDVVVERKGERRTVKVELQAVH